MEPDGLRLVVLLVGCNPLTQPVRVECFGRPERPAESPAPDGTVDAFEGGMHPRTSTRKRSGRIRYHFTVLRHASQQLGGGGVLSAAKAGSYGFHPTPLLSCAPSTSSGSGPLAELVEAFVVSLRGCCRAGCRCVRPSALRRDGRSALPCRLRATAGSRAPVPEPPSSTRRSQTPN